MRSTNLALSCFIGTLAAVQSSSAAEMLDEKTQASLIQKAKEWEIPQPGPNDRLVELREAYEGSERNISLGFDQGSGAYLVGANHFSPGPEWKTKPAERPLALATIRQGESGNRLITGVQLLRRGETEEGRALVENAPQVPQGGSFDPFVVQGPTDATTRLAISVLISAQGELFQPNPAHARLSKTVNRIMTDYPALKALDSIDLASGLAETAKWPVAASGTMEAVIDGYVIAKNDQGKEALALKGFEAVPAILRQLDSRRFSNHSGAVNFRQITPRRAGEALLLYLGNLANREIPRNKAEAWWKEASAMGEEAYLGANIVVTNSGGAPRLGVELLTIAKARYPRQLGPAYRKVLEVNLSSEQIAAAIADSGAYTKEEKQTLLQEGLASANQAHQRSALKALGSVDPAGMAEVLIRKLDETQPSLADGHDPYPAVQLARIAGDSTQPSVWEAIHRFLDRADTGMRVEFINGLTPQVDAPPAIRAQIFRIYDRFSDDHSLRAPAPVGKIPSFPAFSTYKQLFMYDFTAMKFAQWLQVEITPPSPSAAAAEWSSYRKRVREAVEKGR